MFEKSKKIVITTGLDLVCLSARAAFIPALQASSNRTEFLKPVETEPSAEDFFDQTNLTELRKRAECLPDDYFVCLVGDMNVLDRAQLFGWTVPGTKQVQAQAPGAISHGNTAHHAKDHGVHEVGRFRLLSSEMLLSKMQGLRVMWSHRENVALEVLVAASGALMDMILLASGYQSSGDRVLWQPGTIEKALGWASFLEEAMQGFPETEDGISSRKALDSELARFRIPGLPQFSCDVLKNARRMFVNAVIQAFGIENGQVSSALSLIPAEELRSCLRCAQKGQDRGCVQQDQENAGIDSDLKMAIAEELLNRFTAKSCTKALSDGLELALDSKRVVKRQRISIWKSDFSDSAATEAACDSRPVEIWLSEKWRKQALSYLTSPKTIYKLSAAMSIFEGDKQAWSKVLDTLMSRASSGDVQDQELYEVVELCLLKLASRQWTTLIAMLSRSRPSSRLTTEPDVEAVEDYLLGLLRLKSGLWWKVPPVLAAVSCHAASQLSGHYVRAIGDHVTGKQSSGRCPCHGCCCNRECCIECKDAVHERAWAVFYLGAMQEQDVRTLKKLCIQPNEAVTLAS